MAARMRRVGQVGDAVRREVRPTGCEHSLLHRLGNPRVEPVHDDVVELAQLTALQLEHIADVEAHVLELRGDGDRARGSIALSARSMPTAWTSGWAVAMPARCAPAPQPSSSTRAVRGSAGESPWSVATNACTRGSACTNGTFPYGTSS